MAVPKHLKDWVNHVKKESKKLGLNYKEALKDKRVRKSYKKSQDKGSEYKRTLSPYKRKVSEKAIRLSNLAKEIQEEIKKSKKKKDTVLEALDSALLKRQKLMERKKNAKKSKSKPKK